MFRNWYLNRFFGPKCSKLNPSQMDFAQYCADRSETALVLAGIREKETSQLREQRAMEALAKAEAKRAAKRQAAMACGPFLQMTCTDSVSNRASSSKDDASSCSFSVVSEQ